MKSKPKNNLGGEIMRRKKLNTHNELEPVDPDVVLLNSIELDLINFETYLKINIESNLALYEAN
jgi:hypothetical protein